MYGKLNTFDRSSLISDDKLCCFNFVSTLYYMKLYNTCQVSGFWISFLYHPQYMWQISHISGAVRDPIDVLEEQQWPTISPVLCASCNF